FSRDWSSDVCSSDLAGTILQAQAQNLDIRGGVVVDADTGRERISLDEVARIAYFRPDTLPHDFQSELMVVRHYVPKKYPFAFTILEERREGKECIPE